MKKGKTGESIGKEDYSSESMADNDEERCVRKSPDSTSNISKEVSESGHEDLESKEEEEYHDFAFLLGSRQEILCYKFIHNIRKRLENKKGTKTNGTKKKKYLTEIISVSEKLSNLKKSKNIPKNDIIDDLDKYIESLNLNDEDLQDIGISSTSSMDIVLGTHWKEMVSFGKKAYNSSSLQGNVVVPDASAWGRRLFHESEIDGIDEDDFNAKYAMISDTEEGKRYISCSDRDKLLEVGLWDMVYDSGLDLKDLTFYSNETMCS